VFEKIVVELSHAYDAEEKRSRVLLAYAAQKPGSARMMKSKTGHIG